MATTLSSDEHAQKVAIRRLTIQNFRCFDHMELDFEDDLTVLVAPNGGGKSAVLEAVIYALAPFLEELAELKLVPGKEDARLIPSAALEMVATGPITLQADVLFDAVMTHSPAEAALAAQQMREGSIRHARSHAQAPQNLPVVVYYGVERAWNRGTLVGGADFAEKNGWFARQTTAYHDAFSPSTNYARFTTWFERMTLDALNDQIVHLQSPRRPHVMLAAVQHATDHMLRDTGWEQLTWDFTSGALVARHPTQGQLPVSMLSDGIRNTLMLVGDLAHRCARLNPHFGEEAAAHTPGIVLIDEVDLHLHPSWQQTIIGTLRKAFPKVQFIVTTHSPQVLSTVEQRCIRIMDPSGEVSLPHAQTQGVESGALLAQVMGVHPVPNIKESQDLSAYRALIEDGLHEGEEGLALREKLIAHFGKNHEVMQSVDRLARFQRFRLGKHEEGAP